MEPWPATGDTSWERTQDEINAAGLGDGLPVVPPTAERITRMLVANGVDPEAVICQLAPLFADATWQGIAINAVMAGCKPEYLPLDSISPAIRGHLIERRRIAGDADVHAPLKVAEKADDIMIVIAGGVGIKAAYIPTWGGSTRAVSRRVRGG